MKSLIQLIETPWIQRLDLRIEKYPIPDVEKKDLLKTFQQDALYAKDKKRWLKFTNGKFQVVDRPPSDAKVLPDWWKQLAILTEESELDYPVEKRDWFGIEIEIENPAGTVRSGINKETGEKWETLMKDDYGRIPNNEGLDGDMVDCFIFARGIPSKTVYKVSTKKDNGNFDESKWMLGYPDVKTAENAFREHYDHPGYFGFIETVAFEDFARRAKKGHLTEMKLMTIIRKIQS